GARRARPRAGRPRRRLRLAASHRAAAGHRSDRRDVHHADHPDAALRDAPGGGRAHRRCSGGAARTAGAARAGGTGPPDRARRAAAAADLVLRQLAAAATAAGAAAVPAGATAVLLAVLRRPINPAICYARSAINSRTSAHLSSDHTSSLARRARSSPITGVALARNFASIAASLI